MSASKTALYYPVKVLHCLIAFDIAAGICMFLYAKAYAKRKKIADTIKEY